MATIDDGKETHGNVANRESDVESPETQLKREKARAKASFTRCRHRLLHLIEEQDLPSRRAVKEECRKLDMNMEVAMDAITKLSELYTELHQSDKCTKVVDELETIENAYSAAHESAQEYIDSRKDEQSSVASDTVHVDLLNELHLGDTDDIFDGTKGERRVEELQHSTRTKVRLPLHENMNSTRQYSPLSPTVAYPYDTAREGYPENRYLSNNIRASHWTENEYGSSHRNTTSQSATGMRNTANASVRHDIGQDLWKQLKRVQIPVFTGDKRTYAGWKAAFLSCIDNAPATAEYKLLQLRQYLSGEALGVIEHLGHSATAYEAAKERLERKYGGMRRQIAMYLEELDNFQQVRHGFPKDLECFADLLDIAIINLKEAGRYSELGDGSLYIKLQRKLPESMLARFHRWVFETSKEESVTTLRLWLIQESEFQIIASETVHGLNGKVDTSLKRPFDRNRHQRSFYGGMKETENKPVFNRQCKVCGLQHAIWKCREFIQAPLQEKWNIAKRHQLCYRCLCDGHQGSKCMRSRLCGIDGCRDLHNRLLHNIAGTHLDGRRGIASSVTSQIVKNHKAGSSISDVYNGPNQDTSTSIMEGNQRKTQTTMMSQSHRIVDFIALRTVPVILSNGRHTVKCNALLDDASTKTYVNADIAAELGIQGKTEKVTVNVLNGQVETFETRPIEVGLQSIDGSVNTKVSAYTANRVTGNMNAIDWNRYKQKWQHLQDIEFPKIGRRPIVDILIGSDYADLQWSLKEIRGAPGEPIARLTPLGWTCIGNPDSGYSHSLQTNFASTYFVRNQSEIEQLNVNLRRFWEIEEVSRSKTVPIVRMEEKVAMKTVAESLKYEDGMYHVSIPWKERERKLPDNYKMAVQRLENTERKLQKSEDIKDAYQKCIDQYIEKGYVRKVPKCEIYESKWYLPHFPVVKPDKDTTKIRIVFDASAKYDGVSLNDAIHQGPKLQRDLFDVLLRFRRYPVAIVCDIAEMYLRIGIAPEDKYYHRFLWRGMEQTRQPDVYEFNRVVFGLNSSPFQAQYVSQHHAKQYQKEFPLAAETVLKSTYMDDSMDSVQNEEDCLELYRQLSRLWTKAGMHARKWISNSAKVLKEIPIQDRKSEVDLDSGQLPDTKTLGVWWVAEQDIFTFKETAPTNDMIYTKCNFLKKIATLFDPIGLLAPYTVRAKMLLQEMWTAGLDWDEKLDEQLEHSARAWFNELRDLTEIRVSRSLPEISKTVTSVALHTFADASELAYGAAVYARYSYDNGTTSCSLVAAKTRFWSDSLNTLWWIRGRSREFRPFVANRVGEIQSHTNPEQWRYVPTKINPADLLSRGMNALDLVGSDMWWKGPAFLRQSEELWPVNKLPNIIDGCNELKNSVTQQKVSTETANNTKGKSYIHTEATFIAVDVMPLLTPERYSSWTRLTRIQAWVSRFVHNCKLQSDSRISGELRADEIKTAEIQIIKITQRSEFIEEWTDLSRGKPLKTTSKILSLQPQLDEDGLMRSNGRLKYAEFLSYGVRYPVILPRRGWITKLIVKHFHELGNHASGTNQTLAALSACYWIISGREVIREWEKECADCRRRKAKACKQVMAPLPTSRLQVTLRAFAKTAVDFGGPFITIQGRGKRREKRYLCLFTCLSTRAVHLEVAHGLDTDSFMNAFYRMASRRGLPDEMLSDNGTNFKSADKELKTLVSQLDTDQINNSTANKGVQWNFNPPLTPHFGGVHETMIKAAKKAMKAIMGNADVTDEELWTAVIGAESLLNSRPLTYQSADPLDNTPLTPNHFLHGQMGGQFAPETVDSTEFSPRRRWRRIQELVRHFWHRWLREWLPGLTARKKWLQSHRDIQVGEVVLVISPDTSRGNWPLGRVTEVYPGRDGYVRVAKVQVGKSAWVRPISKLCPLECNIPETTGQSKALNN